VARLAGDPGTLRWLRFAAGFRLPADNTDWVRHELTDAGWRGRTVLRHLAVIIPVCVVLAVVLTVVIPAPLWLALTMIALILCGSVFTAWRTPTTCARPGSASTGSTSPTIPTLVIRLTDHAGHRG